MDPKPNIEFLADHNGTVANVTATIDAACRLAVHQARGNRIYVTGISANSRQVRVRFYCDFRLVMMQLVRLDKRFALLKPQHDYNAPLPEPTPEIVGKKADMAIVDDVTPLAENPDAAKRAEWGAKMAAARAAKKATQTE